MFKDLLNLNIIVDQLFFCCVANSKRKESQAEENRYLIEQQTEVGSTIPTDTQNILIIFLSTIAVMKVIF